MEGGVAERIWRMGVAELAGAVRAGDLSCRDAVSAHLDRIASINPRLNAATRCLEREALRAADEADAATRKDDRGGALRGVPITLKDNIDLVGSPTTQGSPLLRAAMPARDAPLVERLKRAGAIPIARTNLPDFGLRWHTDSALYGPTLNPWDPSRTPGGSSGGDAVAVATGMAPAGIGNDYGGSLRYPAQCCGVMALRPTPGRIPQASTTAPVERPIGVQLIAVQGPIARRVSDLRLLFEVMRGADPRDPWSIPEPRAQATAVPRRVAMLVDPGGIGIDREIAAAVRRAGEALAVAGYDVEVREPPHLDEAFDLFTLLTFAEIRALILPQVRPLASAEAIRYLELTLAGRAPDDPAAYMQGLADRTRIARAWAQFALDFPLLLGPVSTAPPFEVGFDLKGAEEAGALFRSMRLVVSVSLLGLPAVALPIAMGGGRPQGVQLIGPRYGEALCLDAAEAIERSCGAPLPIDPRGRREGDYGG
jgi:amidase